MYPPTYTQPYASDVEILGDLAIRGLLRLAALLVTVALLVTWVPQLHPTVCDRTSVLGLPTACALEGPTQATLDVLGIREASTLTSAAQGAAQHGQQALGELRDGIEQTGAGSSAQVAESKRGLEAVNDALAAPLGP